MKLGQVAVFANLDPMAPSNMAAAARRLEALGYDTLYFPVSLAHDSLVQAAGLLHATSRMNIATGIVPIYDHSPQIVAGAQRVLFDQSGGRFLLGLGVSHQSFVEGVRGVEYGPPVTNMRGFLKQLDESIARTTAALSETEDAAQRPSMDGSPMPRVIAALGPRMMETRSRHVLRCAPVPGESRAHRSVPSGPRRRCVVVCGAEGDTADGAGGGPRCCP